MKKIVFAYALLAVAVAVTLCTSCAPYRTFFVNSEGILSYNRHTGQLELIWEHHSGGESPGTDTLAVDSLLKKN